MRIRVASAQIPKLGQSICGDDVLVVEGDTTLVVVVDGLGHGPHAATAAACFTDFARRMCHLSPQEILGASRAEMSKTRGAVASVAKFDVCSSTVRLAGIGNIEVRSRSRTPISPVFTPGIIGRPVRNVREFEYPLNEGDLVVFASDGVSRRFDVKTYAALSVDQVAARVLQDFGASHDDATCVAVSVESDSDAT